MSLPINWQLSRQRVSPLVGIPWIPLKFFCIGVIGQNAKRTDTLLKVNGTAQFALDVQLDGMLYATVVHSPVFGGKLKSFNEHFTC